MSIWVIPYIDQPVSFWQELNHRFGEHIREVFFPVSGDVVGTGRSRQPDQHINAFLKDASLTKSVLVNAIVLPQPLEQIGPRILHALAHLHEAYGVNRVVVSHVGLAHLIRNHLPDYRITASVLMGISTPAQVNMLGDAVDAIVPDSHIVRDLPALKRLRKAFSGDIRLIVNEACLPHCVFRTQHFYEMGYSNGIPQSLCNDLLEEKPWLRLTGAWVLPRHLHHYDGLVDGLKLAGRVTLHNPEKYVQVLGAYINRAPILPVDIGGGPASLMGKSDVTDEWYAHVIQCDKNCASCSYCEDFYRKYIGM